MSEKRPMNLDPLYQLFEHHLMTRSYEDSSVFTKEVAEKYLAYLDSTLAHIPLQVRTGVLEDLELEAHEMLVKKMYGMVQPSEYENYGCVIKVKNDELSVFEFGTPMPPEESTPKK
jgi:hypothetical protein